MRSEQRHIGMGGRGVLAAMVGLMAVALLVPPEALGTIRQEVSLIFEDPSGNKTRNDDVVEVPPDPALRTVSAAISGALFSANGSVGVLGDLGVAAEAVRDGRLSTAIRISSDEFVNPFSTPQHAVANFIVDGGFLSMVAGPGSELFFRLSLRATVHDALGALVNIETFEAVIELEETAGGLAFQTSGQSLGTTFDGVTATIPLSFQSFDLAVIPPGGSIEFVYLLFIEGVSVGTEIMAWQYSDPVHVDGTGAFPTIRLVDVAVPQPSALVLLGTAILGLVAHRRYRR